MSAPSTPDRRLLFVRNMEAFEGKPQERRTGSIYEFEVLADVPAHGSAQTGPVLIRPWDVTELGGAHGHSLVLSIRDELKDKSGAATKEGFFHDSGPPGEICALASVVLRRRISLGPLLRLDDTPMRVRISNSKQSPQLVDGKIDLAQLPQSLAKVRALPEDLHEPFLLSCRLYQESLDLLDERPEVAYLLLVSAVEVFVARLGLRTREEDLPKETLILLDLVADASVRKKLVDRFLELDRGIQRNFVRFMMSHVTQEFWEASPKCSPAEGRVESSELEDLLNRVYNQRSLMVHVGQPFPPNIENSPKSVAEIDRSIEVTALGRRWAQSDFLPYVRFFERLVQHVLTTFLDQKAKAQNSSLGESHVPSIKL
jgi:hypothetical protein